MRCDLHCPAPGGGTAVLVAVPLAIAAAAIASAIGDIVLAAAVIAVVLVVAGITTLAWLLRRDRPDIARRAQIDEAVDALITPKRAPIKVTATVVPVITDVPERVSGVVVPQWPQNASAPRDTRTR